MVCGFRQTFNNWHVASLGVLHRAVLDTRGVLPLAIPLGLGNKTALCSVRRRLVLHFFIRDPHAAPASASASALFLSLQTQHTHTHKHTCYMHSPDVQTYELGEEFVPDPRHYPFPGQREQPAPHESTYCGGKTEARQQRNRHQQ